ncbi:MAG: hypothetical protein PHW74_13200 [Desulfobacca sp.]|nr:hypothetical protein [Desulfobacca sp.]
MLPRFISKAWLIGIIAVAVLGVVLILVLQRDRQPSPAPSSVSQPEPSAAPAAKPGEAEPAQPLEISRQASLQTGLEKVLYNLKEANLNKDIILYMSCLSFLYPELDKKRQEVLTTWGKFDFKKMVFTLSKIRELGSDNAVAEVTWSTLSQNLTTKNLQTNDFSYKVWFAKELGQWKIKKIEDLES